MELALSVSLNECLRQAVCLDNGVALSRLSEVCTIREGER